ncbi:MAG: hypothetical protein ACOYOA_04250 [Saprospiraceae bacterium]
MARLTTFSRFLITLAIIGAIFFGVRKFLPNLGKTSNTEITTNDEAKTNPDGGNTSNQIQPTQFERPAFNYTPPAPVNGKLKGVVEMGATGFNSFIIRIDANKNWKLEKSQFGASLIKEGLATDQDIKNGLKSYIAEMLAFGVGGRDIHFVISSGAKKEEITNKIIKFLGEFGYVVNTVTPEQEGRYALKACLPSSYAANSFVTDIGSSNTKISYTKGGRIQAYECQGAKYFQNQISDIDVANDVAAKSSNIPTSNRETCFILGGVPYELAKQVRNGKERYTVLKAPGDYKAEGDKQRCGLNIYNAIAKTTNCKQFIFDWDANFTIGFLLEL